MAIPSRGIGWGTEDNLLWQISKQLERLTCVTAGGCGSITTTTTSSTTAAPVYKVFTALLTQSGGNDPQSGSGFTLTIGVTYEIGNNSGGADFTTVGAPNNDLGTKFVATGTNPNWGNDVADLSYNTGAPVVNVLENTIGNVWFEMTGGGPVGVNGTYLVKSSGLFTNNKSIVFCNAYIKSVTEKWINSEILNNNDIYITTGNPNFANDVLNNAPIEIRVYN